MKPLLILRPEPGAAETAARAQAQGLQPQVFPLFEGRSVDWGIDRQTPYDAIFITSANALNYGHIIPSNLPSGPVFAVGAATAAAARAAGFTDVYAGDKDAAALADLAASLGHRHLLWLAGRAHMPLSHPDLTFDVKIVYDMVETPPSASFLEAVRQPCVALIHSPNAARRFAALVPDRARIDLVAISEKAAMAAGPGWATTCWPERPSTEAMLHLAAPLCRRDETGTSA